MILSTIESINDNLLIQLGSAGHRSGLVVPFYDQQAKATSLMLADSDQRLTLDSKQPYQIAHLLQRLEPVNRQQFGSYYEASYSGVLVLMGVSKSWATCLKAEQAIKHTSFCQTGAIEVETLAVLRRYWQVKADQDKNYDPALYAFAITYKIEGISDEDIQLYLQTIANEAA